MVFRTSVMRFLKNDESLILLLLLLLLLLFYIYHPSLGIIAIKILHQSKIYKLLSGIQMDYTFSDQEDKEFQSIFYFAEKLYPNTTSHYLSEEMTIVYNNHIHSTTNEENNSGNNKFIVTLDSISEPISEEAISTLYQFEKEIQRKANEELEQSKKRNIREVSSSSSSSSSSINTEDSNENASNIDEQPKPKIVLTEEQRKY